MAKNPFSLYDFLGYVFPGSLFLFFFFFTILINQIGAEVFFENIFFINFWRNSIFSNLGFLLKWDNTLIIVLLSYILGHFISFVSSITIEIFAIWSYGYPSKFLLNKVPPFWYFKLDSISHNFKKQNSFVICIKEVLRIFAKYVIRIVIFIMLFPISLLSILLGQLFGFKYLVIKQINKYNLNLLDTKLNRIMQKLSVSATDEELKNTDFIKLLYHYYLEKNEAHRFKFDNYIALYGFLRAMCFMFCGVSMYLVYQLFLLRSGIGMAFYDHLIIACILFVIVTYLFYLDFLKFYRRFSLEVIMCLLTDKNI